MAVVDSRTRLTALHTVAILQTNRMRGVAAGHNRSRRSGAVYAGGGGRGIRTPEAGVVTYLAVFKTASGAGHDLRFPSTRGGAGALLRHSASPHKRVLGIGSFPRRVVVGWRVGPSGCSAQRERRPARRWSGLAVPAVSD